MLQKFSDFLHLPFLNVDFVITHTLKNCVDQSLFVCIFLVDTNSIQNSFRVHLMHFVFQKGNAAIREGRKINIFEILFSSIELL